MTRILIILSLTLVSLCMQAQDYKIDGDNIVVSKVVNDVKGTKDDIYKRVKSYFTRSYGDANSVIQTDDKDGGLIIAKGLYTDLASFNLGAWKIKAYHIIREDINKTIIDY